MRRVNTTSTVATIAATTTATTTTTADQPDAAALAERERGVLELSAHAVVAL